VAGNEEMRFEFATANRIIFGPGTRQEVPSWAANLGQHALILAGFTGSPLDELSASLESAGLTAAVFMVDQEPTIELVRRGLELAREVNCDVLVGMGGGSALDTGKAIAILMTNPGEILDYLEVIGKGKTLTQPGLPYLALPTTAGTGAEVTRNAVLGSPEHQVKVSLRSPLMLPTCSVVDPELTLGLPPSVTASTGLDALTQLIEPFLSNRSNPLTDALCLEGIPRAARSLKRAYQQGSDLQARQDMSLASLFGGLALANAKLGAVHGFAGPLGGMLKAPHGAICARLLPFVMQVNLRALHARGDPAGVLPRFEEVARLLTGRSSASAQDGVAWIQELCQDLNLTALSAYGLTRNHFPELIEKSARASSMKGNPLTLTSEEMQEILEQAL